MRIFALPLHTIKESKKSSLIRGVRTHYCGHFPLIVLPTHLILIIPSPVVYRDQQAITALFSLYLQTPPLIRLPFSGQAMLQMVMRINLCDRAFIVHLMQRTLQRNYGTRPSIPAMIRVSMQNSIVQPLQMARYISRHFPISSWY